MLETKFAKGRHEVGAGQQREEQVVLRGLLLDLVDHLLGLGLPLRVVLARLPVGAELEVVGGDAVLEEGRVDEVEQGLREVGGVPLLGVVDPHDPVAEVVVVADDVGVGVVDLVVAVLPVVGRGDVVPLPHRRVDLGVAHPVPLAVDDVVPDLHVVEDLGDAQAGGAGDPGDRVATEEQHRPRTHLEVALGRDHPADVAGVGLAEVVHHRGADLVELAPDLLDVCGGQVGDRVVARVDARVDDLGPAAGDAGVGGAGGALEGGSHVSSPSSRSCRSRRPRRCRSAP